jgi:hypothetical protein
MSERIKARHSSEGWNPVLISGEEVKKCIALKLVISAQAGIQFFVQSDGRTGSQPALG